MKLILITVPYYSIFALSSSPYEKTRHWRPRKIAIHNG